MRFTAVLDHLPAWMRSARFRISLMYSVVLFAVAAALLGSLYFALLSTVRQEPVSKQHQWGQTEAGTEGDGGMSQAGATDVERAVNRNTLDYVRRFSLGALGVLFGLSLAVGWVVSGRVLAPIGRITNVANRIQATDLSQRIGLPGPQDELKRLADTFDRMLGRLDDAFAAQRRFVADASHELRNPLAVIKTNLDVLLSDPDPDPDDVRDTAQVVERATERMSVLVDDLLALARLESPSARADEVDVASVADEVAQEFSALGATRRIRLSTEVAPELWVRGDRTALKRAVANLVENALRFAPEGSSVLVSTGARDGWVWGAVRDEGPGIAPENVNRVFDRFWRADKSRSREFGGSGLGLAIVRQVVGMHSGTVRLFSRAGEGSTFVIWIPAATKRIGESERPPEDNPVAWTAPAASAR